MKICDLQSGSGQLQRETKRIRDAWQQAKKSWQDGASKEFEDKYLQPLIPNIKLALAAVHELSEVMEKAERELGDQELGE